MLAFKRPFIWLKRIRHRCGYGVHSPFAFDFITSVIYEKGFYYAYSEIESSELYKTRKKNARRPVSKKLNRLLFRLVNRMQPECIFEAGEISETSLYLQAACKKSTLVQITDPGNFPAGIPDFLYIPYTDDIEFIQNIFCKYAENAHCRSVFVIGGIGYSAIMKRLWKEFESDNNTGITFDLYDIGIIFFDKTRIKQHYIVNF